MSTWYPPLPCREAVSKLTFGQSPATRNPQHLRREIWHYPKAMADIIDESRWCFQAMLCRGKCCRRLWFKQGVYSWHRSLIILVVPVTDPNTNLMHWSWRLRAWRFRMTPKRALRSSEILKPKIWDQIKYRCSWSLMYWRTSGGNTRRRTSIPLVTSLVDEQSQWENGSRSTDQKFRRAENKAEERWSLMAQTDAQDESTQRRWLSTPRSGRERQTRPSLTVSDQWLPARTRTEPTNETTRPIFTSNLRAAHRLPKKPWHRNESRCLVR